MSSTLFNMESFYSFSASKETKYVSKTAPLFGESSAFSSPSDVFLFDKNEALSELDLDENIPSEPLLFTTIGMVHRSYNKKSKELLETIPQFELE